MTENVNILSEGQVENAQGGGPNAVKNGPTIPSVSTEKERSAASSKIASPLNVRQYSWQVCIVMIYYVILLLLSFVLVYDAFSGNFGLLRFVGAEKTVHEADLKTIFFTIIGGFLGSILYGIRILFYHYARAENFDPRWLPKYYTGPLEGAGLALVVLALIRGGVAAFGGSITTETVSVNNFTAFATGALVGYGTRDVVGWIGSIIKTTFASQEEKPDQKQGEVVEP